MAVALLGCKERDMTYKVGVSQYSNTLRDREMASQISYYTALNNDCEIEYASAECNVNRQIQQIESFISARVDALVVSSNVSDKLCGVLDEALERGIEVVLVDEKSPLSRYSAYIENNNDHIGVMISRRYTNMYANKEGTLIELIESSKMEQSQAIHNALVKNASPYLHILKFEVPNDSLGIHRVVDSLLSLHSDTRMILAHFSTVGFAVKELCRDKNIDVCGVEYDTKSAVDAVINKRLDASVLYTVAGNNAMKLAQKLVMGERVEREQSVFPQLIEKYNAKSIRKQYRQDRKLNDQIQKLNSKVANQTQLTLIHKVLLLLVILFAVVTIATIITLSRRKTQRLQLKMRELLSQQSATDRHSKISINEEAIKGVSSQDQNFIVRLGHIIEENLSDPNFGVEQMSDKLNYSNIQAYRKIKALTGETPLHLLRSARVKRGDYLLRNTDKTIAEISIEVGFATPANFSKYYKVMYETLPSKIDR